MRVRINIEYDGTKENAQYIADQLDKTNILVTRLAQGLPMGSELDYIDDGTLLTSFKSRRKID